MKLSVVIPVRNEEGAIEQTLTALVTALRAADIPCEILAVDDGSTDSTAARIRRFAETSPEVRLVSNSGPHGYGMAVRAGLAEFTGDAVIVMMGDLSDSPEDAVRYYRKLQEGYDCVFGSRFCPGARVTGYPVHKLVLNRLANGFINILFGLRYNDTTNAFKCYRREVIQDIQPLISPHFNLTVEMPLKAIIHGYSFASIPISWTNRTTGISKLKLKEMGSRYLSIVLYLWLQKVRAQGKYAGRGRRKSRLQLPHP